MRNLITALILIIGGLVAVFLYWDELWLVFRGIVGVGLVLFGALLLFLVRQERH